ncbi:hypothetical protein EVAR_97908_1 [Eumeta japonica]|uniref:Uncharacterized protein n=1 Tax=Eumeta variegata TaxID=151549 RepID=A0A4C1WFK1_EUMVA|nr:hypothetical protein EVAR_97908_1 [Eumeta japonica]
MDDNNDDDHLEDLDCSESGDVGAITQRGLATSVSAGRRALAEQPHNGWAIFSFSRGMTNYSAGGVRALRAHLRSLKRTPRGARGVRTSVSSHVHAPDGDTCGARKRRKASRYRIAAIPERRGGARTAPQTKLRNVRARPEQRERSAVGVVVSRYRRNNANRAGRSVGGKNDKGSAPLSGGRDSANRGSGNPAPHPDKLFHIRLSSE